MNPIPGRLALQQGWKLGQVLPGQTEPTHWLDAAAAEPLAATLQAQGLWQPADTDRALDDEHWVWRLRFDRPEHLGPDAVLGLDGLATLCEVQLNGQSVLNSDNMFIAHRLAVGHQLRATGNELRIHARPLTPRLAERRPRPRWRVPMLRQQQLRWWRTTLLGRTPGWSLPAPPLGPWRGVWLADPETLLSERLQLRARVEGQRGVLDIHLPAALGKPGLAEGIDEPVHLTLQRAEHQHHVRLQMQADGSAQARLVLDDVALWWPHTHGEPALYDACLWLGEGAQQRALPLAPIGFRTLRWQRDHGDFALHVNGVPVFARGACWTPLDPLRLHAPDAAYAPAVAQVCAAGMNMLRVCGSMVYEADAFYSACDAQGVLVWQDFMFANMDYPADDPTFLRSVQQEAQQQLQRWLARPSLALLCGNSEVAQQAAMWGAERPLWQPALFHEHLPAWCEQALPDTAYWPSSAWGGSLPFAPDSGSSSYYGVGAYQRPVRDATASGLRFASECLAFAQVPEASTLDRMPGGRALRSHHPAWKQASPRDLGAGWDFEDVRDHYLAELFALNPAELRRHDFDRYLMLSRVAVARTSQAAFSRWRAGNSACRGALVWFLRDLQPGAGWGLLDDQGQPKASWHALSQVLQPVALLLTDEGLNGLQLHLVNDTAEPIEAMLSLSTWRGTQRLDHATAPQLLAPRSTRTVPAQDLLEHFTDLTWAYKFGPPPYDFLQATLHAADAALLGSSSHLCAGWLGAAWDDPGLQASCRRLDAQTVQVEISTERAALAVQVALTGYAPEAAYFDMAPGSRCELRLRALPTLQTNPTIAARSLHGQVLAANARRPTPITAEAWTPDSMPAATMPAAKPPPQT